MIFLINKMFITGEKKVLHSAVSEYKSVSLAQIYSSNPKIKKH